MNARETDGRISTELYVTLRGSGKKPDFRKTAKDLLAACREFYRNPENEMEFQKWLSEQKKK